MIFNDSRRLARASLFYRVHNHNAYCPLALARVRQAASVSDAAHAAQPRAPPTRCYATVAA